MKAALVVEGLSTARSQVEQACRLLTSASPELIEGCPRLFETACAVIADSRPWLETVQGDPQVLAEARRLQIAIRQAARLLENAWQFHSRWNRILETMVLGYTGSGDPAPIVRRGRLCLTG